MNGELESLMRDVGRIVEGEARRQNIAPQVQARLAARHLRPSRSATAVRWTFALGGVAACAAAAVLVLRPFPISYTVAGGGAGAVGAPLVASAASPLDVRFSDGSSVTIPPRAAAHVDALDRDGATVAIEDGTLEVSVIHRAHTRWQVRAGDYRIQVTGTRFAAGWDRSSRALTVTMHEGSVLVTGPGLKEPVRVVTGQRLRASASGADLGLASDP
ncbi:MAG TPA: FecR family protein, partial [Polyangia bacterium]|nr:FecR family protein [Polyangia bacterium]